MKKIFKTTFWYSVRTYPLFSWAIWIRHYSMEKSMLIIIIEKFFFSYYKLCVEKNAFKEKFSKIFLFILLWLAFIQVRDSIRNPFDFGRNDDLQILSLNKVYKSFNEPLKLVPSTQKLFHHL